MKVESKMLRKKENNGGWEALQVRAMGRVNMLKTHYILVLSVVIRSKTGYTL